MFFQCIELKDRRGDSRRMFDVVREENPREETRTFFQVAAIMISRRQARRALSLSCHLGTELTFRVWSIDARASICARSPRSRHGFSSNRERGVVEINYYSRARD
jgi:hypothetical protein